MFKVHTFFILFRLTVSKDGPNKGRQFYKCSKQPPCNFFEWADSEAQTNPSGAGQARQSSSNNAGPPAQAGKFYMKCVTLA